MTISAIIPARYNSTRFPGKPLALILGKTMIRHVYERVQRSKYVNEVIVATDDERILSEVESFGGKARMTSPHHPSGTDRVAEVARELPFEIIVNVQGDEPLIDPQIVDLAIETIINNPYIPVVTLKTEISEPWELTDPNVVKVVTDKSDFALYFSRSPIPFIRDSWSEPLKIDSIKNKGPFFKHIGLYVYRRDFLILFSSMKPSTLEILERLEQLRILENGYKIKVVKTDFNSIGVDTPEDLRRVELLMRGSKGWKEK
jgi:3-deoxy-manno-octulosonate cytidylyltransferase (CMP-KDO synthetase)